MPCWSLRTWSSVSRRKWTKQRCRECRALARSRSSSRRARRRRPARRRRARARRASAGSCAKGFRLRPASARHAAGSPLRCATAPRARSLTAGGTDGSETSASINCWQNPGQRLARHKEGWLFASISAHLKSTCSIMRTPLGVLTLVGESESQTGTVEHLGVDNGLWHPSQQNLRHVSGCLYSQAPRSQPRNRTRRAE